ncbi:MAG: hypothetical protein ABUT39_30030 [Acidobacteriota bacterium]
MNLSALGSLTLPFAVTLMLAAWLIAGFRSRDGKPAGWSAILLAGIAPPLLVTLTMLAAMPRFGDLRVALEGVRFRLEGLGQDFQVRVGGAADKDHLVIRDLPPGFLTFHLDGSQVEADIAPPDTVASQEQEGEDEARKPFAVVRVNGKRPFHNAVSMDEPARVVVNGTALDFDPDEPAFGAKGFPEIPWRTTKVLDRRFRVYRELRAEQAIHPLRYYGSTDPERELLGPQGQPLGSFVARDGRNPGLWNPFSWVNLPELLRRRLYLVLVDEAARVERPGKDPIGFERKVATIEDGKEAEFALFRVDYIKPWREKAPAGQAGEAKEDEDDPPPSRVQERRSFKVRFAKGVLDILFETPSYVQLGEPELASLERRAKRFDVPALLRLVGRDFIFTAGEGQMLLEFPVLGDPLATELFSRVELPANDRMRVTTHTGARSYRLGDAFEIGDAAAAIVRVTRLGLPWGTLLLVWIASMVAMATGRARRERLIPLVLLSVVELLLALRVLIAYEGAYIDPSAASAAWQSLGAFIAVPFILQATLALYEERWSFLSPEMLIHAGVVVAALATILVRSHGGTADWVLSLGAVLGVPVMLGWIFLPWLDRRQLDAPVNPARIFRPVLWAAALLLLIRLPTLGLLGWKERIDLGVVLAVSIYYTPMALWIFARLWARRSEGWRAVGAFALLLIALYPLTFLPARDLGALLIFPIPVLLLFTLPLVEEGRWPNAALAAPFLVLIFLFVILPWVPELGLSPRLTGWTAADVELARSDKAVAEELLASRTRTDQNQLRLWNVTAPTELRQVGTQTAEGLVIVMANLRDYAGQGALGAGYLGVPLSNALRATHLDDNLSVVHILAAFGWFGGLAFLALLCAMALAPVLGLRAQGGMASWLTPRTAFGLMIVWTIAVAGLYMFSANVELLLFTGKNVYFLAAASRSDLVEGTLLVVLALWALAGRRTGP